MIMFLCTDQGKILGQGILAGDTLTPGIVYVDMDNVSISANWPEGTECAEFDFNNDGVKDLKFCNSVWSTMGSSGEKSKVSTLNNAKTVYYEPNPNWVAELDMNTLIYSGSGWENGGVLKSEDNFPDTVYYGGVFSSGYLGFKTGNIYGWVLLTASPSWIFIQEYAYQSNMTGVDDLLKQENIVLSPNPASSILHLQLSVNHNYSEAIIMDLQGRIVSRQKIDPNQHDYSLAVSSLKAGMYFLQLNGTNPSVHRFVKK